MISDGRDYLELESQLDNAVELGRAHGLNIHGTPAWNPHEGGA